MSISINDGATTGKILEIASDKCIPINLPVTEVQAGYSSFAAESDAGSLMPGLVRTVRPLQVNPDFNTITAHGNTIFNEVFTGATIDMSEWKQTASIMTIVQGNGMIVLNSAAATAQNNYAILTSYHSFPLLANQTLYASFRLAVTNQTATGKVAEVGLGYVSTTDAPTDGAFFRWGADGTLIAVLNHNGVETSMVSSAITKPTDGEFHFYLISLTRQTAEFWIDDYLVARITPTVALPRITKSEAYPFQMRVYNSGNPASAACKLNLGQVIVDSAGAPLNRPYSHMQASLGNNCNQGASATWTTLGTQSNWTNSPTIATATLANNAVPASGYTGTTLGGLFQFAGPVANLATTLIVFAFTVPAGSATVHGKTLYVTDVRIDSVNIGIAVASTPTTLQWLLASGSTAVTLATADGATTRGPRYLPLGIQTWPVGAAIGAQSTPISVSFQTPIPTYMGQIFYILMRPILGTATGSQLIRGSVAVGGYYE